jgi:hypothetical protein
VTLWLKARTVYKEEVAIARKQCSKLVSAATAQHATIEEMSEAVFYVDSCWPLPAQ